MSVLFFFGLILITLGLFLIFFVIFTAFKIRKKQQKILDKDITSFQKLVPINLAGLCLSFFGILILFLVFFLS
tara:strand:+ start:79 stop:297 length:219 start_codon:yes stop_codon:yes gene_type:complete